MFGFFRKHKKQKSKSGIIVTFEEMGVSYPVIPKTPLWLDNPNGAFIVGPHQSEQHVMCHETFGWFKLWAARNDFKGWTAKYNNTQSTT